MTDLPPHPPPPPPPPPSGGWAAPGSSEPAAPTGPPTAPPSGGPDRFDPAEPPRGRRRSLALVAGGIVSVLALVTALVAFAGDGGDDSAAPTDPTTTTTAGESEPSTSTTTEAATPPVSEEEFLSLVAELQAYVAEARGLEFLSDVVVELDDGAEFEARLLEDFEDDLDEIEDAEVFYRALGLLEPDQSLVDELRAIFSAGVLGFYDTETNELVVRGRTPTPYVQQTIVHELVHALDDQHFELNRPEYDDRKDEISVGLSAVVEGNASRIESQWLGEQPAEFREQVRAEEAAFAAGIDISSFPPILLFQIGAPYQQGEVFVGQLVNRNGERGVDAALTDPPDTSEQFFFIDRYTSREPRVEVPPPPADGELVDDGVVGALFLYGLFTTGESTVNPSDAVRAVDGWGGDWAVTWTDGDLACVRADFVGDTDRDTDEIDATLTQWAESVGSAQVSRVDGRVRLESCGGGAGSANPQV